MLSFLTVDVVFTFNIMTIGVSGLYLYDVVFHVYFSRWDVLLKFIYVFMNLFDM